MITNNIWSFKLNYFGLPGMSSCIDQLLVKWRFRARSVTCVKLWPRVSVAIEQLAAITPRLQTRRKQNVACLLAQVTLSTEPCFLSCRDESLDRWQFTLNGPQEWTPGRLDCKRKSVQITPKLNSNLHCLHVEERAVACMQLQQRRLRGARRLQCMAPLERGLNWSSNLLSFQCRVLSDQSMVTSRCHEPRQLMAAFIRIASGAAIRSNWTSSASRIYSHKWVFNIKQCMTARRRICCRLYAAAAVLFCIKTWRRTQQPDR